MKRKIFVVACSIFILTSCKKEKAQTLSSGNPTTSVTAVEDTKALSRVTIRNNAFNFDERSELIDLASALTRAKTDINAFKQYYTNKNIKPLELKFDRIDDANNDLSIKAEEDNSTTVDKCPEFLANLKFYKQVQYPNISELRYVRNVNWAPLAFVLNEDGEVYIGGIKYHLDGGDLVDDTKKAYKIFDGQLVLTMPNPAPLCNGFMGYNTPADLGYAGLTNTAGKWTGYFYFYLNYNIINSDRCNFTYKVVMTSIGNVTKNTSLGNQNDQMYHLGNFTTNSIPGTLPGIESAGSGYYYNLYGTSSTVVVFNQTIVANNANGYYHTPTSLTPVSDIVRFRNGVATFNFDGGSSGGGVSQNYQNF